ncbi:MAG: hypothetical protein ACD_22C00069G0007 [uncultured bacterium]|nr:MAG: hypothetical protein ACD_22C00069G0007 [uncultured bacterium]
MVETHLLKTALKVLRRNYGCPGLDGVSVRDIKRNYNYHLQKVIHKLEAGDINTLRIKHVYINDYRGNCREIYVYCLYERWIQSYLKLQINKEIDNHLCPYVFGYRKGLSSGMLSNYIFGLGAEKTMHLDIEKFYESINLDLLMNKLYRLLDHRKEVVPLIIKSLSNNNCTGLPQGNVLSPMLSNLYLSDVDHSFERNYARFSDDMYFAYNTRDEEKAIIEKVTGLLSTLGLKINWSKVEVLNLNEQKY